MGHLGDRSILPQTVKVALSAHDLTVNYGKTVALDKVSFEIPRGACCAVVGPNGGGKSTLFKCALGLVKPVEGSVAVLGDKYTPKVHRVSYIPQRSEVDWDFPATVFDAVLMGIENIPPVWSSSRKRLNEEVLSYLDCVGMKHLSQRSLKNLSGGQQQRVFFARALAQRAELYLMDEPFSGVDAKTEEELTHVLQEICSLGKTVVIIHHDIHSVPHVFSHVLLLKETVVACGTVRDVWTTENLRATFSSRENGRETSGVNEEARKAGLIYAL
jgi:manganese/zinc/iron transport system ATP- binding protein